MALWISTVNVEAAEARLRAEMVECGRWAQLVDANDVRAVLDELQELRARLAASDRRVDRRTNKIVKLRTELAALRETAEVGP